MKELCDMDRLIESVGERREIKSMEHHDYKYPTTADINSVDGNATCLPRSLQLLLGRIIKSKNAKLHMAQIGQSIMQSRSPRSFLSHPQVGLSVTLEHKSADMVSNLDFCSSYSEANKYRATVFQVIDLLEEVTKSLLQYKADNIDHASMILDGYGSIHVMGQIAKFTPGKFLDSR